MTKAPSVGIGLCSLSWEFALRLVGQVCYGVCLLSEFSTGLVLAHLRGHEVPIDVL